MAYELSIPSQV